MENQPTGCVWELAIVDFERRAWIEDVLANSPGPDLERYLAAASTRTSEPRASGVCE